MTLDTKKIWKVYLLKCADNTLYCGASNDVEARIGVHNKGKGAKYTRSRLPVELVAVSDELTRSDAFKLEYQIKKQPAHKKIERLRRGIKRHGIV